MGSESEKKDLISLIQGKFSKLSKGQKIIAQFILVNYDKAAFMTAAKLGETVGVSESTVVRFANALGYSGYPLLQKSLQELIKTKLTTRNAHFIPIFYYNKPNAINNQGCSYNNWCMKICFYIIIKKKRNNCSRDTSNYHFKPK